jgi:hypothetical protein
MRRLLVVLGVIQIGVLSAADPDPFAFFQPGMSISTAQVQALERGEPVVAMIHADGRELAVFSAIAVGNEVNAERALAWMRQVEQLRKGQHVLATARFSTTPRLEDLEGLTLDDEDLEDIRDCRRGRCGLKLSANEIAHLQHAASASRAQWKDQVQAAFREIVLARVLSFSRVGHAALEDHCDRSRPRSAAAAFAQVLDHSLFLRQNAPHVARRLAVCAASPLPGGERIVYWAKERLGSKPVVSATSLTLLRGDGIHLPEVFTVGVQIFATHYLDASLAVMALVRDERAGRSYFVYVHRSEVDVLGGFWGGFARSLIEARIKRDGPPILREAGVRLSKGDPD